MTGFLPLTKEGIPYIDNFIKNIDKDIIDLENKRLAFENIRKSIVKGLPEEDIKKFQKFAFRELTDVHRNKVSLLGFLSSPLQAVVRDNIVKGYIGFIKENIDVNQGHRFMVTPPLNNIQFYKKDTFIFISGALRICTLDIGKSPDKIDYRVTNSYIYVEKISRVVEGNALKKEPKISLIH